MKNSLFLIVAFLILNISLSAQTIIFTGNGGDDNWENPANWNLNRVPNANDEVTFASNQIVIVNAITEIRSLVVEIDHLLEIKANLTVKSGHPQTGIGIENRGGIFIDANATLFIEDVAKTGILNQNNITVAENGAIRFTTDTGFSYYDNAAIDNSGEISNSGDITLSQDFDDPSNDNVNPEKALINTGIIRNFDFFSLDDIMVNEATGQIINQGSFMIEVKAGRLLFESSDEASNFGTITNETNGEMEINRLENDGQITTETNSTLSGDFLLNQNQIDNAGTLRFKGIRQKKPDTKLTNTGILEAQGDLVIDVDTEIDNQNTCQVSPNLEVNFNEGEGTFISGTLLNSGTANFDVGTLNIAATGKLNNTGTLNFGANNPFFFNVKNLGLFENQSGATINIAVITATVEQGDYWLHNLPNATFRNAGEVLSINQGEAITFPDTVIVNLGTIENLLGGDIQLHHAEGILAGIFNQNIFTNQGNITIGKTNESVVKGIVNQGTFRNESPANLKIDNTTVNAILNDENAVFQNVAGDIFIGQTVDIQQFGIVNKGRWESERIGELTPFILIETGSDDAVVNETTGEFFNAGDLRLGVNGAIGRGGIFNQGSFENLDFGDIRIENFGSNFPQPVNGGISNNGTFSNAGKITIKQSQNNYSGLLNRANATFINQRCGKFTSDLFIENIGEITNNGFWESLRTFPSHSNLGTFTNNGLLEDPFDSFGGLGSFPDENELVNNGIVVRPVSAEDDDTEILNTFDFGNEVPINFSFGGELDDEVFDVNNQDIGRFNIADNIELENPLAQGEHELHFEAQDPNLFCRTEITLFVSIEPEFSCNLQGTAATNGNNNGAITTEIEGGTAPFTFAWQTPDDSEPTTQNLSNLASGSYILTITDAQDRSTICETFIGMNSESPECNGVTIHWDGGVSHDANGSVITDDNNQIIFGGDGRSWSDPLNWRGDRVPDASDAVGGFFEFFELPENRRRINLDVDAQIESFSSASVSGVVIGLTIPAGKKLTVACSFRDGLFENAGELEVTAGTAELGNFDFVNEGTIKVTGVGSDDLLLKINSGNTTLTNRGTIEVNNLARTGQLLFANDLLNEGEIRLKNGSSGLFSIFRTIENKANGIIEIENVNGAIGAIFTNRGEVSINKVGRGISKNLHNTADGRITINEAEICLAVALDETFINEGFIKLGSPTEDVPSNFEIGILNEGTFINEDSLIIDGFTEIGIQNENDFSASTDVAPIFTNEVGGFIELNGQVDERGRPIPEMGILNLEAIFENRDDLFIKDIKKVGIRNIGRRSGFNDVPDDLFRNEGVITINFIGVNHNKPAAMAIHNTLDGQFINENEILIGTIKDNFTIGGKIKGVGIYNEVFHNALGRDSSRFENNKLIKIDNIIHGGQLNGVSTGHGILTHQRVGRHTEEDAVFVNKGDNPFGTGLLQIGGHKRVAGAGVFMKAGAAGIKANFLNENGATIRINQTGGNGVELAGVGNNIAQFDNAGILNIGDQITIENNGIKIVNSEFYNQENGVVNINATLGNGVEVMSDTDVNVIFDALFKNESEVKIGNAAGIDKSGIVLKLAANGNADQRAEFRNLAGSTLHIDRCGRSGIEIIGRQLVDDGHLEFENHNVVNIGQQTPDNQLFAENGIDVVAGDYRDFNENTSLKIDRVEEHGIRIETGTVSLRGTVDIGTNQVVGLDGFHLVNSASRLFSSAAVNIKNTGRHGVNVTDGLMSVGNDFNIDGVMENGIVLDNGEIRTSAEMNIDNLDGNAIEIFGAEGRFDNNALLKIGEVPVGGMGIVIDDGADFNNTDRVEIVGALGIGIFNDGNIFNFRETSVLFIDNCDTAVVNRRSLSNGNADAQILIQDYKIGVINERVGSAFAQINNNGTIRMRNDNPNFTDTCLKNISGGFATNNGCGKMEFFGHLENNGSTFRNFGFLTLEEVSGFKAVTNQGTFENNGVIEDVQQRLNAPSLTINNDIILHPTCVGNPNTGILNNAVLLGDNVSFTIDNWTANGVGAGTYDQAANTVTFANPFPNQIITANFTVTNTAANCAITAQERVDFRTINQQGIATNAGEDQLDLCEGTTQLAAQAVSIGATGVWNITQNPDGQGVIANAGNPFSDFTGAGGQTYVLRWTVNADCGTGSDEVTISFAPDADGDGICDAEDICGEGEDDIDDNENGIPDPCECVDEALQVPGFPIEQSNFKTAQTITATGRVAAGDQVKFRAKESITLGAGFRVEAGAQFLATIEDCAAILVESEIGLRSSESEGDIEEMEMEEEDLLNFENLANLEQPQPMPQVNVYPNPTQGMTNIDLNLSTTENVRLELYDLRAQRVATLVENDTLAAGRYQYHWSCPRVTNGMYMVVLNGRVVSRLVVMK